MDNWTTKPVDTTVSVLVTKRDAKRVELESLTDFIDQMQAILESAEPTEQMREFLKSMEDRKATLEEKVANYQEDLQSYQEDN